MAFYQAKQIANRLPLTETAGGGSIYSYTGEFIVPTTALAVNDVIEMTGLPPAHILEALTILSQIVDSNGTPLFAADVGFISGTAGDAVAGAAGTRTVTADFFTATGAPFRLGGSLGSTDKNLAAQIASTAARGIGLKVTAAAATQVAGARIRFRATYSADCGDLT